MKSKMRWFLSIAFVIALCTSTLTYSEAHAQGGGAPASYAPRCTNGTILGSYGYRLDGSIPGVPALAIGGSLTHSIDVGYNGVWTGSDTVSFAGLYSSRANQGTYKLESNCRGTGFYTDSLGNRINYVITAVDGGDTIYFQGTDPGVGVTGVGRRIR
ncbi:MAG: hypothetical protein ACREA2_16175 [Blastocatellia bacterium]